MGHNLGMSHDFKNGGVRRDSQGRNCYGYMDYKDDTNYWSTCSVEDFMKTNKDCLKTANNRDDDYSDGTSDENGNVLKTKILPSSKTNHCIFILTCIVFLII